MRSISHLTHRARAAAKPAFHWLLLLITLAGWSLSPAPQAAAQGPGEPHPTFLPLVSGPAGSPNPGGAYGDMLQQAQTACAATQLDQVCYAAGEVSLEPKSGTVNFSQPGAVAGLSNVKSLSLTSSGADSGNWSLAWLRLKTGSAHASGELTILAYGNVEISSASPYAAENSPEAVSAAPGLQFSTRPVAGASGQGSSGLIVSNPSGGEIFNLTLNGASISLDSTILAQTDSGGSLLVTTAAGSSLVSANDADSAAVLAQQVSVPLGADGQPSGPPSEPAALDPEDLALEDLIPDPQLAVEGYLRNLNRSIDRCTGGSASYVYNVLYWTRIIERNSILKPLLDPGALDEAYERAHNCLRFEVDFDSTSSTSAAVIMDTSRVQAQGVFLEFNPDGSFAISISNVLNYLSYNRIASVPGCTFTTTKTNGRLIISDGSLRIAGNEVQIAMDIKLSELPQASMTTSCPPAPPNTIQTNHWSTSFLIVHRDLWHMPDPIVTIPGWMTTGGEHYGEAILVESRTEGSVTYDDTSFLILIHKPAP